jgi:hypothetical protein
MVEYLFRFQKFIGIPAQKTGQSLLLCHYGGSPDAPSGKARRIFDRLPTLRSQFSI